MAGIKTTVTGGGGEAGASPVSVGLTRRDVLLASSLAATSLAVGSIGLPLGATGALASAPLDASALQIPGRDPMPLAETPEARVTRLGLELAAALRDTEGPPLVATVYPLDLRTEPVILTQLQTLIDAETSVSPELMRLIVAHCSAYSALDRTTRDTDPVELGREPDDRAWQRLDEADERERELFLRLCSYTARNDPERQDKADYLLGFVSRQRIGNDAIEAILQASCVRPSATAL